ncbi:MAG: hypothetical protein EA403_08720 [Spirochaetaceae bacterium]|nr:MAG: hypothetical protein EA403_08720 [Spirochaetaceae bacterium]
MNRWKRRAVTAALVITITSALSAQTGSVALDLRIARLDRAGAPELVDDHVLFTYEASPGRRVRHVGVAFRHENFRTIHTFFRFPERDGEPWRDSSFFFAYPLPRDQEARTLEYRLVVDGIWTSDPANPNERISPDGVRLSRVDLPARPAPPSHNPMTVSAEQRLVRFVLEPGDTTTGDLLSVLGRQTFFDADRPLDVRIAGSFNRWDPFMHVLREVPGRPGRWEIELAVPPGNHSYYFVVNGIRIIDPHNPQTRYHREGYYVSFFSVR